MLFRIEHTIAVAINAVVIGGPGNLTDAVSVIICGLNVGASRGWIDRYFREYNTPWYSYRGGYRRVWGSVND
jgi:hypothetical protein